MPIPVIAKLEKGGSDSGNRLFIIIDRGIHIDTLIYVLARYRHLN